MREVLSGRATALNRDRDVSRTSWHKGNSSRKNQGFWGVSSDILGVLFRHVLQYTAHMAMGHGHEGAAKAP